MKKQTWEEPQILVQKFIPNEYIAACGDHGKTYLFTCDAGGGVPGSVYQETNGVNGLQTRGKNPDKEMTNYYAHYWYRTYFEACNEKHKAESDSVFLKGYYCAGGDTGNPVPVIIWKGENGDDIHCTTNLEMDSWETERS